MCLHLDDQHSQEATSHDTHLTEQQLQEPPSTFESRMDLGRFKALLEADDAMDDGTETHLHSDTSENPMPSKQPISHGVPHITQLSHPLPQPLKPLSQSLSHIPESNQENIEAEQARFFQQHIKVSPQSTQQCNIR